VTPFEYVWYPDPNHPYNHPAPDQPAVVEVKDSTGRQWKLFIAGPHELGAIELGDERTARGLIILYYFERQHISEHRKCR
jgi:hypothetical protein